MAETLILETDRLRLIEFTSEDTIFILELLNTPGWIRYIGDSKIQNTADAETYIQEKLEKSYEEHGFGLWRVNLKESNKPIGTCGLLKRDYLDHVDIGYAILPAYYRQGFAFEAASSVKDHARNHYQLEKLLATTDLDNTGSQRVLKKLGMTFQNRILHPSGEEVSVYACAL